MKCEEVRIQLAAYRRSEWEHEEQRAVNEHLTGCSTCRRWEAEARQVGDHLRALPSFTPPASFRDRVFAAIKTEQVAIERGVSPPLAPGDLPPVARPQATPPVAPMPIAARADAPRAVAVIERIGEVGLHRMRGNRVFFGKATAIATIAALFALVFAANAFDLLHISAPSGGGNPPLCVACFRNPDRYVPDAKFSTVTGVVADTNQVIYTAQNDSGQQMIFVRDRSHPTIAPLLPAPSKDPLTLQALSGNWLIWLSGISQGSWSLLAAPVGSAGVVQPLGNTLPIVLATHDDLLGVSHIQNVTGVWTDKNLVIVALALTDGSSVLQRIDLAGKPGAGAAPLSTTITRSLPGHTLSDCYLDGTTVYWVDTLIGPNGAPHSLLMHQNLNGQSAPVAVDYEAYRPVGSSQHMAWFEAKTSFYASSGSGVPVLTLIGTIVTQGADGKLTPLSDDNVALTNVWRGAGTIFWRDSSGAHLYRVADGSSQDVDIPAGSLTVGISASTIAWTQLPIDHTQVSLILVVNN